VKCKSYKESIIRLNKARSSEEQSEVAGLSLWEIPDRYKIEKMVEVLNNERKRFGMKGRY
jgi:hypothetical protein